MKDIIIATIILGLLYFLYTKHKTKHVISNVYKDVPVYKKYDQKQQQLMLTSNFVKPSNAFHHLFEKASKELSPQNKLQLTGTSYQTYYNKAVLPENLHEFLKLTIERIIKKTVNLQENVEYFLKEMPDVYQMIDSHGNQRYIVMFFLYDIRNFYHLKLLTDFLIINENVYINYIGEDFSSSLNIVNRYDYRFDDSGYLANRNLQNDIYTIVDGYYKQNYQLIGYDSSPLEYSHYISKLDSVKKYDISDLSKYYVPEGTPSIYDPRFGNNYSNDWDERGINLPTGDRFEINNNSVIRQPNNPLDSPGSEPHTRNYEGEYSFIKDIGLGVGYSSFH